MSKERCKTGVRINYKNVTELVEWKCPCCLHRWYEYADEPEYPETCPLCGVSLDSEYDED